MLECKDKEQAVLYLFRLYNLHPVDTRALRPPAEEETLRTNGRKSSKKKAMKMAVGEEVDELEEDGLLEDVEGDAVTSKRKLPRKSRKSKKGSRTDTAEAQVDGPVGPIAQGASFEGLADPERLHCDV